MLDLVIFIPLIGAILLALVPKDRLDEIYGRTIVMPGKALAAFASDVFDARIVDGFITGIGRVTASFSEGFRRVQTGYVRSYALVFLFGAVTVLSILVVRVS